MNLRIHKKLWLCAKYLQDSTGLMGTKDGILEELENCINSPSQDENQSKKKITTRRKSKLATFLKLIKQILKVFSSDMITSKESSSLVLSRFPKYLTNSELTSK